MKDDGTRKINFSFIITNNTQYSPKTLMSLRVNDEIVPEGEAAIPYLVERISKELERVTGLKLPGITETDRGVDTARLADVGDVRF